MRVVALRREQRLAPTMGLRHHAKPRTSVVAAGPCLIDGGSVSGCGPSPPGMAARPRAPDQPLGVAVVVMGESVGSWSSDSLVVDYWRDGRHQRQRIAIGAAVCVVAAAGETCDPGRTGPEGGVGPSTRARPPVVNRDPCNAGERAREGDPRAWVRERVGGRFVRASARRAGAPCERLRRARPTRGWPRSSEQDMPGMGDLTRRVLLSRSRHPL